MHLKFIEDTLLDMDAIRGPYTVSAEVDTPDGLYELFVIHKVNRTRTIIPFSIHDPKSKKKIKYADMKNFPKDPAFQKFRINFCGFKLQENTPEALTQAFREMELFEHLRAIKNIWTRSRLSNEGPYQPTKPKRKAKPELESELEPVPQKAVKKTVKKAVKKSETKTKVKLDLEVKAASRPSKMKTSKKEK
ncbi:MAG: hypothetical protein IJF17_14145 [Thermoguttaceae bacterium]|nr:hypothetical protein [Thermoguttaceae bacterium]